jgi:hypothetical protein
MVKIALLASPASVFPLASLSITRTLQWVFFVHTAGVQPWLFEFPASVVMGIQVVPPSLV